MKINTKFIIYYLVSIVGLVSLNELIKEYSDFDISYGIIGGLLFCTLYLIKNQEKLYKLSVELSKIKEM